MHACITRARTGWGWGGSETKHLTPPSLFFQCHGPGIEHLMEAEKRATKIVKDAREQKTERMKQVRCTVLVAGGWWLT